MADLYSAAIPCNLRSHAWVRTIVQLTSGSIAADMKITAIDIPTASGWGTELNEGAARKHAWNRSS